MRALLGITAFILLPIVGASQGIDRSYQTGLLSQYRAVVPGYDGHWLFAANLPEDNSFFQPAALREIDGDGEIVNAWDLSVPWNELTFVEDLELLQDSSVVVAGATSPGCDFGPFQGHVRLFAHGAELWQRTYAVGGFSSVASNDSLLALLAYDGLLLTSHTGDSILLADFGNIYPGSVQRTDSGFVVMGYGGAAHVSPNGAIMASITGVNISDMRQLPAGGFIALVSDSLLELSSELLRTGNGLPVPSSVFRRILVNQESYYVVTNDSLYTIGPEIGTASTIALLNPEGFYPQDACLRNGELNLAGYFSCGVVSAAYRTIQIAEGPPVIDADLAVTNMVIESAEYTLFTGGIGQAAISGTAMVSFWLVNRGQVILEHATLNRIVPYAICGFSGNWEARDDLSLLPGDSMQFDFGPLYLYQVIANSGPTDVSICVWGADPNRRLDRDHSDNEACATFTVWVGVEELSDASSFTISPNPSNDHVRITHFLTGRLFLTIHDSQGRTVSQKAFGATQSPVDVDVSSLEPGLYILTLSNERDVLTSQRLVVN